MATSALSFQKQNLILERFVPVKQIPTNSVSSSTQKKVILLKNIYTEQKTLMKVQSKSLLQKKDRNILHQASFFQKFQGHLGVPLMIWSGQDFDCLILIIQQLGSSIYERMRFNCRQSKMRVKDACMIGIMLLDIIQNFHQKDYLHRNVTPEAFCFGLGDRMTKLFTNDLLYMKKYRIKNGNNHIQYRQNVKLQYVTPFLSNNVLKRKQYSRRDDIISIGYLLIFLMKGKLPWQEDWEEEISLKRQYVKQINDLSVNQGNIDQAYNNSIKQNEKISRMIQIQQNVTVDQLCKELPRQIKQLLEYSLDLQFTQKPEYALYKTLLKKVLFKTGQKLDYLFEWMESQEYINKNLRVSASILDLSTLKKQSLERIIYLPYESNVNIDKYGNQRTQRNSKPNQINKSGNKKDPSNSNKIQKINNLYQKHNRCQII